MGDVPVLTQMMLPTYRRLQPFQAHVFLLKVSRSVICILLAAAMLEQVSSATTVYDAHDPSALGFGERSGRLPAEQHTFWSGTSVEHSVELGLYLVKSLAEMPHLLANDPQLSPEAT
jgi:hypothetical protein